MWFFRTWDRRMQKICFLFTVDVGRKSQNSAAMTLTKGITTGQKLLVSQRTAELLLRPPLKKEDSAKEINFFFFWLEEEFFSHNLVVALRAGLPTNLHSRLWFHHVNTRAWESGTPRFLVCRRGGVPMTNTSHSRVKNEVKAAGWHFLVPDLMRTHA